MIAVRMNATEQAIFNAFERNDCSLVGIAPGRLVATYKDITFTMYVRSKSMSDDPAFLDQFLAGVMADAPVMPSTWEEARPGIVWTVEGKGMKITGIEHEDICGMIKLVPSYVFPKHGYVSWVTPQLCEKWGVTTKDLFREAAGNLNAKSAQAEIGHEMVEGHKLYTIGADPILKASFVFAGAMLKRIKEEMGFPVYTVLPCRDFVYLIPNSAESLISQVAQIANYEFQKSLFPIGLDVLLFDDHGISVSGSFQGWNPN